MIIFGTNIEADGIDAGIIGLPAAVTVNGQGEIHSPSILLPGLFQHITVIGCGQIDIASRWNQMILDHRLQLPACSIKLQEPFPDEPDLLLGESDLPEVAIDIVSALFQRCGHVVFLCCRDFCQLCILREQFVDLRQLLEQGQ